MTAKELIEKLKTVDPDVYVFIKGYEGGYDYIAFDPEIKDIQLDVHEEWYLGRHDDAQGPGRDVVKAMILKAF